MYSSLLGHRCLGKTCWRSANIILSCGGVARGGRTPSLDVFGISSLVDKMSDFSEPNAEWFEESHQLFNKLNKLTINEGRIWKRLQTDPFFNQADGSRIFFRPILEKPGKFIELAFFANTDLQILKGVVQFGMHTRGPPGYVHGGAVCTILDEAMADLQQHCGRNGVTANINTNFKRPIPLKTTILVEAKIDKIEGRKTFTSAVIKSPTEDITYADSTGLFIKMPVRLLDLTKL